MGLLDIFGKTPEKPQLLQLPSGSFTVDASGRILTSTLPRAFPEKHVQEVSRRVLEAFRQAREAGLPLNELIIRYSAFKITAREQRGGAMVFLAPQGPKTN
jgi:hypothetical protein